MNYRKLFSGLYPFYVIDLIKQSDFWVQFYDVASRGGVKSQKIFYDIFMTERGDLFPRSNNPKSGGKLT